VNISSPVKPSFERDDASVPGKPPAPKPGWMLVVCGDDLAAPVFVERTLDELTARLRGDYRLILIARPGHTAGEWGRARGACLHLEPVLWQLYGRYAEPRWAMRAVADANGVVIFGPEARYWRVARYARDAGVPIRLVAVPAACAPPAAAVAHVQRPDRSSPAAIATRPAESWGDYFPNGVPRPDPAA
jgi:hypothetical protein